MHRTRNFKINTLKGLYHSMSKAGSGHISTTIRLRLNGRMCGMYAAYLAECVCGDPFKGTIKRFL